MNLFNKGNFKLNSGQDSWFKIDCDYLNDSDWQALASLAIQRLDQFGPVEGVPTGGLKFAQALSKFSKKGSPMLIVDDVLTSGGSMERQRAGRECLGIVVFARKKPAKWITPLFLLTEKINEEN